MSAISSGFCYNLHEAHPHSADCLGSWISLAQGVVCTFVFIYLMRKFLRSHSRALAGYAKNTINIESHARAFSGVICFYILWAISAVFDINRNYKAMQLNSPGIYGNDIGQLTPLLIGACILRGFSNFVEYYVVLILASNDIGERSYKLAWKIALGTTLIYLISIVSIVIGSPGQTSIYWPLKNLAILYAVRESILSLVHFAAWYFTRNQKLDAPVNATLRTYFSYVAWLYFGFFLARVLTLTTDFFAVNLGICGDNLMRFVQFVVWGPMTYASLKRNCQYWATDLDLDENEETLKSHTENMAWSTEATTWQCVIPKAEIYFRKKLEERMDISVEVHFWRRRHVVVKRFRYDLLTKENIKLFKNEASLFKDLVHPNIIAFYGVLIDPPSLGIVMEYATNGDLLKYLEKQNALCNSQPEGRPRRISVEVNAAAAIAAFSPAKSPSAGNLSSLPSFQSPLSRSGSTPSLSALARPSNSNSIVSRVSSAIKQSLSTSQSSATIEMTNLEKTFSPFRCARQIADAMRYLHDNDIIHRDLKSPNILLGPDYTALIADFGESRMQRSALDKDSKLDDEPTGTPGWAAPESMLSKGSTIKADVFSFGIILWELLCWRHPMVQVRLKDLKDERMMQIQGIADIVHTKLRERKTLSNAEAPSESPLHVESLGETTVWQDNPARSKLGAPVNIDDEFVLVEICDAALARVFLCEKKVRPPIPKTAPQWLHTLLCRCWFEDPQKRPTFSEIISVLDSTADANGFIELPYDIS